MSKRDDDGALMFLRAWDELNEKTAEPKAAPSKSSGTLEALLAQVKGGAAPAKPATPKAVTKTASAGRKLNASEILTAIRKQAAAPSQTYTQVSKLAQALLQGSFLQKRADYSGMIPGTAMGAGLGMMGASALPWAGPAVIGGAPMALMGAGLAASGLGGAYLARQRAAAAARAAEQAAAAEAASFGGRMRALAPYALPAAALGAGAYGLYNMMGNQKAAAGKDGPPEGSIAQKRRDSKPSQRVPAARADLSQVSAVPATGDPRNTRAAFTGPKGGLYGQLMRNTQGEALLTQPGAALSPGMSIPSMVQQYPPGVLPPERQAAADAEVAKWNAQLAAERAAAVPPPDQNAALRAVSQGYHPQDPARQLLREGLRTSTSPGAARVKGMR